MKNFWRVIIYLVWAVILLPMHLFAQLQNGMVRNPDQVSVSAYDGISTTNPDVGALKNVYIINTAHRSRVRQTGKITKVQFYMHSKPPSIRSFHLVIWRKNGANFNRVAQQNILSLLKASQVNTIVLPVAMPAQEGDYIGFSYTSLGLLPGFFLTKINISDGGYFSIVEPAATNYNWTAQLPLHGYIPFRVYMQAPHIIHTGDSYPSGFPAHNSFINNDIANAITTTFPYKVQASLDWIGQNMGGNAHTTADIAARFTEDVIKLKPKFVVIDGGGNDIAQGKSRQEFIGHWTSMLNACAANNIVPVVMLIPPFTSSTNVQAQTIDEWNNALKNLLVNYPASIKVDVREAIGQYRPGGDAGNLWDIKSQYNLDGVHLNEQGYTVVADLIVAAIKAKSGASENIIIDQNKQLPENAPGAVSVISLPKPYPNPVTDILTIHLNDSFNSAYQVMDLNGRLIKEQKLTGNVSNINMSGLASSIYLVKVISGKGVTIYKVIMR
jgi:lysophospholipase L1-like esterase